MPAASDEVDVFNVYPLDSKHNYDKDAADA